MSEDSLLNFGKSSIEFQSELGITSVDTTESCDVSRSSIDCIVKQAEPLLRTKMKVSIHESLAEQTAALEQQSELVADLRDQVRRLTSENAVIRAEFESSIKPLKRSMSDLKNSVDTLVQDTSNVTATLAKVVKVQNRSTAMNQETHESLRRRLARNDAAYENLKSSVFESLDDTSGKLQLYHGAAAATQAKLDAYFEATLSRIDKFFKDSDSRDAQHLQFVRDANERRLECEAVIREFDGIKENFGHLRVQVQSFSSLKDVARRLIFKLNSLGFDEGSLNLSRKISWNPRSQLQCLVDNRTKKSSQCMPFADGSAARDEIMVTSPETKLLVIGAQEYSFYFVITEVEEAFGIYLCADGCHYPLSLGGTVVSFAGSTIVYDDDDIAQEQGCSCFKAIMPFKSFVEVYNEQQRRTDTDRSQSLVLHAEIKAHLVGLPHSDL